MLLVIKKDLVAIDKVVKTIVRSCDLTGAGGGAGGGAEERGRDNYECHRWEGGGGGGGARRDDISFVSDVS